jgi:hypothetical protein
MNKEHLTGKYYVIVKPITSQKALKGKVGKLMSIDTEKTNYPYKIELDQEQDFIGDFIWCNKIRLAKREEIAKHKAKVLFYDIKESIQAIIDRTRDVDPLTGEIMMKEFLKILQEDINK